MAKALAMGQVGARLGQVGAKMVFGHNLHHMPPFGILEAGFCMVFRPASFWFLVPGTDIGARGQNWSQNLILGSILAPVGARGPNFQNNNKKRT